MAGTKGTSKSRTVSNLSTKSTKSTKSTTSTSTMRSNASIVINDEPEVQPTSSSSSSSSSSISRPSVNQSQQKRSETRTKIDNQVVKVFINTMNSDDYEDWVFLKEILLDLPREYFEGPTSTQVKHYVQRLYDQAALTPALDHLEITQVLEALFPSIFPQSTLEDEIETEYIDLGTTSDGSYTPSASSSERRPNTGKVQFELPKLPLGQTSSSSSSGKPNRSASAPAQRKMLDSSIASSSHLNSTASKNSLATPKASGSIKPKTPRSKTATKNLYEFQFTEMEMPKDLQFKPGVNMRTPRKKSANGLSQSLQSFQQSQTMTNKMTSPGKGRARIGSARMSRTAQSSETLIPVTPNSRKPQTPVLPFLQSVMRPGTAPARGKQNRIGTTSGSSSTTSSTTSSSSSSSSSYASAHKRPKTTGGLVKHAEDDDDFNDSDSSVENIQVHHNINDNPDASLDDLWDHQSVNSSLSSNSSSDENSDDEEEEQEEEEWERLGLLTGEDAVAFFAASAPDDTVKFVYLNRAEQLDDIFRPYDLVIVPRQEVDPYEHFTMSPNGVVHVVQDEDTEYLSLSEWMRNATLYNMLTKISFFKFYLVGKMFRLWRSHVRYKKFCQVRNKLHKKLFWAQSAFVPTLLDVNSLCQDLHKVQILDLDSIVTT